MKVIFRDGKPVIYYEDVDLVKTEIKTKPLKCLKKVAGSVTSTEKKYYISNEEDYIIHLVCAIRPLFFEADSPKSEKTMYTTAKIHRDNTLSNNLGLFNCYSDSNFEFCFLADFINKLNLRSGSIVLTRQHFIAYCNILSQLLSTGDTVVFRLVNNSSFLLDLLILGVHCNRGNTVKVLCKEWLRSKTPRNAGFTDFATQYENLCTGLSKFCSGLK